MLVLEKHILVASSKQGEKKKKACCTARIMSIKGVCNLSIRTIPNTCTTTPIVYYRPAKNRRMQMLTSIVTSRELAQYQAQTTFSSSSIPFSVCLLGALQRLPSLQNAPKQLWRTLTYCISRPKSKPLSHSIRQHELHYPPAQGDHGTTHMANPRIPRYPHGLGSCIRTKSSTPPGRAEQRTSTLSSRDMLRNAVTDSRVKSSFLSSGPPKHFLQTLASPYHPTEHRKSHSEQGLRYYEGETKALYSATALTYTKKPAAEHPEDLTWILVVAPLPSTPPLCFSPIHSIPAYESRNTNRPFALFDFLSLDTLIHATCTAIKMREY
ncbi:uncharacterized protein CLUP02_02358 [Colletotrichum lupini]|uniref:Uncharacterized protein n=1 Tax=Colletotrichum lupini TaxID=145971 RepID=A0A9Q8SE38_9PEZI|nr:uncharacterized protein CLUP02_02358 [Colletotrichum lupini]UQC75702.1 hypothetical protein CLUP02_02358 [Colletotrichum lupini]